MRRVLGLIALLALLYPSLVAAQGSDAALAGSVHDQTGAPVQGAVVSIKGADHHESTVATDGVGGFSFQSLTSGQYSLTVKADGFLPIEQPVRVTSRRNAPLTLVLRLGLAVSLDVVPARAAPPQRRPAATSILTGADIQAMSGDLLENLRALAGAVRPDDLSITVNGSANFRRLPRKDAIEMVRVDANPFSAEFPQRSRKRVEITTKPGSDGLHGGAKVLMRSAALNARNPLADTNPSMRNIDPDGFVSGTLKKDRADFELFLQQARHDENAVIHATTLDPVTLAATTAAGTVTTPARTTMGVFSSGVKLFGQLFTVRFGDTRSTLRNQGLGGGLELEESAHDVSSQSGGGELAWTAIGASIVHAARLHVSRAMSTASSRTTTPGVVVLDAFTGGGGGIDYRNQATTVDGQETLLYRRGSHMVEAGAQFDSSSQDNIDRSGFNGRFLFGSGVERDALGAPLLDSAGAATAIAPLENYRRTLLGLPGYGPSQFSIVTGNARVGFSQASAAWFVLDNWSISKDIWLSAGLRGEVQQGVARQANLAPRLSMSWQLDSEGINAVEAYTGLFYSHVEPALRFDALRLNGAYQQETVVSSPAFFPTVSLPAPGTGSARAAVHRVAADVQMPFDFLGEFSYERRLPHGLLATVSVNVDKGTHQLRSRNTAGPGAAVPVFQVESTGRMLQRDLTLSLWGTFSRRVSAWAGYTLSRKDSDTDGAYSLPADSANLAAEWGPSADDRRHRFDIGGRFDPPHGPTINPTLVIQSGTRYDITTGADTNGDTVFADRPAFAVAGAPGAVSTPYGWLTSTVKPGDTVIPRNLGRERRQILANVTMSQPLPKGTSLGINCQNLLNTTNLLGSIGVLTSPRFGQARRAQDGRSVSVTFSVSF